MKVRKGNTYKFVPNGWDHFDPKTDLKSGDIVKVVHPNGCPPPNTMGCCHVEKDGQFKGLVSTGSLEKI
jgi:hypothetical protein